MTPTSNRQPPRSANRRLFYRVLVLLIVGVIATYFQNGYERDDQLWMFFAELAIYFAGLLVFLSEQTGRLKSGPESNKVSGTVLFEEDPSVRAYIAIYLFMLMLFAVLTVIRGNDIDLGPWNIFVSICPIVLIVFIRQHRLERIRESNRNVFS